MIDKIKSFPIGTQTFDEIISKEQIYVDKTSLLADMITDGPKVWFLARPRRFGKSLTVSTFEAIFSGQKTLFEGLDIEPRLSEKTFAPRTVIRLDMNMVTAIESVEVFKRSLGRLTASLATDLGVNVDPTLPPNEILSNLIKGAAHKSGQRVAVLIDEYDKPFLDLMRKPDELEEVRNIFRIYYSQLKSSDKHISFIFITGVSKFSRQSLFSAFNSIFDISMDPKYGAICGFTHDELESNFRPYIEATAKHLNMAEGELMDMVRSYYDGFCFDGVTNIYNPFSAMQFFQVKAFKNFWFDTGTPYFLADYMKNRHLTVEQFQNVTISDSFADNPGDLDRTTPEGYLYQAGYLTLRPGLEANQFTLAYPNIEVRLSMSRLLMDNLFGSNINTIDATSSLKNALAQPNPEEAVNVFNDLFIRIPYDDYAMANLKNARLKNPKVDFSENLYRSMLFTFFYTAGLVVQAETHTARGRSDLVVDCGDWTWIIELKVPSDAAGDHAKLVSNAEAAFEQIVSTGYAKPYRNRNHVMLAIVVDKDKRTIEAWKEAVNAVVPPYTPA
jgi:hypothetical protein